MNETKHGDDNLLSASDLAARLRCSVSRVERMNALGVLPKPVRGGWRTEDIDRWLASACAGQKRFVC